MNVNLNNEIIIIEICQSIKIFINVRIRENFNIKKIIKLRQIYTIFFDQIVELSITYYE